MALARVHYGEEECPDWAPVMSICRRIWVEEVTMKAKNVTCKNCLKLMKNGRIR